ncbi:ABC-F family ATP-binding cassette domain-containing protein [Paenibacillus sp. KN14-4R]|uniref:ABC-F family ATP-binding cassette domain-containing protein n=1 Tax=Paenibacillus sp. KN14-4R TaxID=3445773 RepID=UPI003FA1476F
MNILQVLNVSKSYGEKVLFDDISFTLNEGQRIGLIGVNGTGKSTLLKLLAGFETADSGKLEHANHFRVEYLSQDPQLPKGATVIEAMFSADSELATVINEYEQRLRELEVNPNDTHAQERLLVVQERIEVLGAWDVMTTMKTVLTKLGITDFEKQVDQMSGGQRKRVAMARALIQPADLLILDEPTNHIDHATVEWLEDYLHKWKKALLIVTHDRYFLDRVTNRILELDKGKMYSYDGNYAYFLEKKAERLAMEAAMEDKRQNLLRRELAWLHRGAKARTTKQKARVERAEDLRDRKVAGPDDKLDLALSGSRLGRKVLEIQHLNKSYHGQTLIRDFNYIVMPNDRLGIIGENGSGKSTLLNMLAGRIEPDSGLIETGQTVKLAYYTQENAEMDEDMRAIDYIKEVAEVIRTADGGTISAGQMLERFLFTPNQQWTPIRKLSGGERRRLYLLRTLMGEPNVLFLDEPTNDLDIETLTILEDYLDTFPGAVITVSHDRYFLDRTCTHLFSFEDKGHLEPYIGTYSEYLEARKERESTTTLQKSGNASDKNTSNPSAKSAIPSTSDSDRPKLRKLSFKDQKEWDGIEDLIASLEAKSEELKQQIDQAGSDSMLVQKLFAEDEEVAQQLEQAMERWTILSEMVEEIERNK